MNGNLMLKTGKIEVPGEIKDNEVTRTDHSGYRFRMESVTSNTPIEKEQEFIIYPQKDEK